jgi:hypothetical protein
MTVSDQRYYLFISYAHKDVAPVKKIKRELNKRGLETWFDEDDILGGRKWEEEIYRGVDHCAGLLVILSPHAVASAWVQKEWQRAQAQAKTIIPILIAPTSHNPLPDIQWVDFKQHDNDEKFLYATYDLISAVCATTDYPDCQAILESIQQRLGSGRIAEHLDEIRRSTASAEQWLNEIGAACAGQPGVWLVSGEGDNAQTSARLVGLALGVDIQDPQISLHAARTIGQCGNGPAVKDLAARLHAGQHVPQTLGAFYAIWESRADGIPNALLPNVWWRVKAAIAWRQFHTPAVWSVLGASIAAAGLGLIVTLYLEFPDPSNTFPLTRLGEALSNGIAYALFSGAGIALAAFLVPRVRILRQARYLVAALSGWLVVALTFIALNTLFYTRVPANWSTVTGLSFLLVLGFAASALITPGSWFRTALRMGLALAGVLAALSIPCTWSILPERLFYFGQDCQPKALLVSLLIVGTAFVPEILDQLTQRGSTFQRLRLRASRIIHQVVESVTP